MVIFNSYVKLPEGILLSYGQLIGKMMIDHHFILGVSS